MGTVFGTQGSLIAMVISFAICAFFRMMQLSITRSRPTRLRQLGRVSKSRWRYARLIRFHTGRYLFICHTGFFFGALWLGLSLATVANSFFPVGLLSSHGALNFALLSAAVLAAASIPLFLLQIFRTIAFNYPERLLLLFGFPFVWATRVLTPPILAIDTLLAWLVRFCGLEYPCERAIAVPADELREIVEASSDAGEIEEEEKEMIKGVFLLADTAVREIMTPRADVISIGIDSSLPEVLKLFLEERLSRILVVGESLDDVRGVVHAKDLLPLVGTQPKAFSLAKVMRPACMVPGGKKVDDVLAEFRNQAIHFAVVLDEHGGVDGVVTVEDLLEEIVGEIFDEFDSPADEIEVRKTKNGDFLIDGSMTLADFNHRFKAHLPEGEYDTIAGFVIHFLSRMPELGETIECNRVRLRIEAIDQNRITELRILKRRRALRIPNSEAVESVVTEESVESNPQSPESKNFELQSQPRVSSR